MKYIHCCPACGHIGVNYYYDTNTIECGICGWSTEMEEKKSEPRNKQPGILYECNRGRCTNCTWPVCQHTTDIKYAANFVNENGYWKEVVRKENE